MRSRKKPSNPSKLNAIRNPDGIWINTSVFSEEAAHFMKHGYYCGDKVGTPQWIDYWTEQEKRCIHGYTVGGAYITGHHYGYLNFAPIIRLDKSSIREGTKAGRKVEGFPDFWDGDYNFFHVKQIARSGVTPEELVRLQLSVTPSPHHLAGGRHLLVGKSRRKGYSYKNGFVAANTYNTIPHSLSLIAAYDKAFLYSKGKGTMVMASNYLNFFNEHTGWAKKRDFIDRVDAKKASYLLEINGAKTEAGRMSEIVAITCKDNPDAVRGKDAYEAVLEELGAWPGFKATYSALTPSMQAGGYITGQIVGFGTGGDMESGTADFADMFYNPDLYNLMPFMNIWDEDAEETTCGFFHPVQWNQEDYTDDQGNSDVIAALKEEEEIRQKMRKNSASGAAALQRRVQEYCTKPAEAFLTVSTNNFPVVELRNRLNKVVREKLDTKLGQPVSLYRDETGKVKARVDLAGKLSPIWQRKPATSDTSGAVVIYEWPVDNAPFGLYKIGYDPVAQDDGTSLASIIVYKGNHKASFTRNTIVAEYTGRMSTADDMNRIFELLCELYNTQGMYENMVLHVKSYFLRRRKLKLLARQPDQVISNAVKDSKVDRRYGIHMDDKLKASGEEYIKNWLLTVREYDEDLGELTNIDFINSQGLLEELISYSRKGNFDRVMALMMVMFQIEEEDLEAEYESQLEEQENEFTNLIGKLFVK